MKKETVKIDNITIYRYWLDNMYCLEFVVDIDKEDLQFIKNTDKNGLIKNDYIILDKSQAIEKNEKVIKTEEV